MYTEASQSLKSVRDLIRFAVSRFQEANLVFGHGSNNAYDEACYLVLHSLHLPIHDIAPFADANLLPSEIARVLSVIQTRVETRKPAAYLTNEAWLGDFRFYVDERVIVPRSFIAELLRDQLAPWIQVPEEVVSVLDMCTGSGCLAIVAAEVFPNADVDAVDLSSDALDVAERNVTDYQLDNRVQLIQSDLFSNLEPKQYDIIISNPPYVNAESVDALPPEYLHEPELALGSGEDGLDATRVILMNASQFLIPGGLLIVEIGFNREELEVSYPELPFQWLDTASGDQFVFMLTREDLIDAGY
ncbi:50S ribosomal protein L3 N(5)-glutamine methyltransferase [Leeia sp. TBRC 13508]|uniref:Ribosomal protein uL3 glutamine methyltransferase n=1 Tax=Leeia speluncae TaxID=2884804 RepID=A0ABS8DAW9_9NEIS|nr:50S ribosomal protein L3 N(5)-glutamine methyltransferase [Leeia speluncae]MCB6185361.1 50S ribosomal protein L3 N(5)-glutamine methyltransferase [Leeia speluncae]